MNQTPIDLTHVATNVLAVIALLGFILAMIKLIMATGKLVAVVEKVPGDMTGIREEMAGIRQELRDASASTLGCLTDHGERIAVVEAMLDLDDKAQAAHGPRVARRRGRQA